MKNIIVPIPENLKNNIMFKVIIEEKEFSLIENQLGFKIGDKIKMAGRECIVTDIDIDDDNLIFTIED